MKSREKPHLLFIFTDQQRTDTLGCYGNPLVRTPNLDRLAGESFVFENAYVTQSLCTPSRSSIMTGLYPHSTGCTRNNIPLRPDTRTIAEMVSHEYACGYYGKWHLGDEVVAQHGFQDWVSIEDYYRQYYSREAYLSIFSDYHHFLVDHGFRPDQERVGGKVFARETAARLPERFTKARFLGERAARFIREKRERPFLLYVNFLEPHPPYYAPSEWRLCRGDGAPSEWRLCRGDGAPSEWRLCRGDGTPFDGLYPPDGLPVEPHFLERPPEDAARINHVRASHWMQMTDVDGEDLATEAGWRRTRAKYLGNVTLVDRAVGDILQALEEEGLAEETIVVYTSDHGDMMGDHAILQKGVMYEEAVKVPLLLRVPWLGREERRVGGRISQIDLVPTLLELLGEVIPDALEGKSRVPVLRGEMALQEIERGDVFIEWNAEVRTSDDSASEVPEAVHGPWRTVISPDGWKLNLSPIDRCELYDLNSDPYERRNLFEHPAQRGRVRHLTARIRDWQARTGDRGTMPTADGRRQGVDDDGRDVRD